jgi:hypothetical protein
MDAERRRHPRSPHPFDGSWQGASGGTNCRIGDLSVSGCFVHAMAAPPVGERMVITIARPGEAEPIQVHGHVRYTERGIGFGVEFDEVGADLAKAIRELKPA